MTPLDPHMARELTADLRGWMVDTERGALHKRFEFPDFETAFRFMTAMAAHSEAHNHHPEWFNVYNRVDVTLTTHDVNGLSTLDLDWARAADAVQTTLASGTAA